MFLTVLGRLTYRLRWLMVIIWICLFGLALVFAPRAPSELKGGGYTLNNSDSVRAGTIVGRTFGNRTLILTAVLHSAQPAPRALTAAARTFMSRTERRYGKQLVVGAPVITPDHTTVFVRVYSKPLADFGQHFVIPLERFLPRGRISGTITGGAALLQDIETQSDDDLKRLEIITLPIALLVLLVIFGSVIGAAVPIVMAPITVTGALAVIYFFAQHLTMSVFVQNTASMLGLGLAIDYSLLLVTRFRDELEAGAETREAVITAVETSGRAILISAVVVSVGFLGLLLSGVDMLSSLGIGGSIETVLSLLVGLTLVPAVLSILGERINMLHVLPRRVSTRSMWLRLAWWVMRRPVPVILVTAGIVVVLALPSMHLRVAVPGPEQLPRSVQSRIGNDILNRELGPANNSPVLLVVSRNPSTHSSARGRPITAKRLPVLMRQVCASPVAVGISPTLVPNSRNQIIPCSRVHAMLQAGQGALVRRMIPQRNGVGMIAVFLSVDPSSPRAENYVSYLRHTVRVPSHTVLVGGQTAGQMDFDSGLYGRFPWVILFVVCTIFVMLLIAFRSLLLPIKAVLMNLFSLLAAYGMLVFIFQEGHFSNLLGFTPVGNIVTIVPVFLFSVLFGLTTDYEVFLLNRIQEEYLLTGDNEESVAIGLAATGRIVTSAATVMVVIFGAFAFAHVTVVQEIGFGQAIAVFVDATLIRALLVPATMRLLGRWNWWLPFRGFPTLRRNAAPARSMVAGE